MTSNLECNENKSHLNGLPSSFQFIRKSNIIIGWRLHAQIQSNTPHIAISEFKLCVIFEFGQRQEAGKNDDALFMMATLSMICLISLSLYIYIYLLQRTAVIKWKEYDSN